MSATMGAATCGKCRAPGLAWASAPGGVVYLRDADGRDHWQTCRGVEAPRAAFPVVAPAPVVALPDADGADVLEALAACDWPDLRRAILAYGGIGASPDFPRDWIPADLY